MWSIFLRHDQNANQMLSYLDQNRLQNHPISHVSGSKWHTCPRPPQHWSLSRSLSRHLPEKAEKGSRRGPTENTMQTFYRYGIDVH